MACPAESVNMSKQLSWKDVSPDDPTYGHIKRKLDRDMAILNCVFLVAVVLILLGSIVAGAKP